VNNAKDHDHLFPLLTFYIAGMGWVPFWCGLSNERAGREQFYGMGTLRPATCFSSSRYSVINRQLYCKQLAVMGALPEQPP